MNKRVYKNLKLTVICWLVFLSLISLVSCDKVVDIDFKNLNTTTNETKLSTIYGPYPVTRVVDGDTIIVDIDGTETRVRMIGVDTPESVHPDESKNSKKGKLASEFTKEQLLNKKVYLEYDEDKEDDYGRTLAYVYLDKKGEHMYQEVLLVNGYANIMIIAPNDKYEEYFEKIIKNK